MFTMWLLDIPQRISPLYPPNICKFFPLRKLIMVRDLLHGNGCFIGLRDPRLNSGFINLLAVPCGCCVHFPL